MWISAASHLIVQNEILLVFITSDYMYVLLQFAFNLHNKDKEEEEEILGREKEIHLKSIMCFA
jgi:hypothetical protein